MQRVLINPLVLFLTVWSIVFILFSLQLSRWLIDLDPTFVLMALATAGSAVLGYIFAHMVAPKPRWMTLGSPTEQYDGVLRVVKVLFGIMSIIFPIEVIVSGGMPIFWLLTGSPKSYVDYGIPTLHGFFNALLLFEGTLSFWLITTQRGSRLVKFIFVMCLLLPIAAITRQVVMSLLTQCFVVFMGARLGQRPIKFARIAGVVLSALLLFSLIGIVRTSSAAFRQQIAYTPGYEWVPVAFMWPYMYFTTPLNNFAYLTTLDLNPTLGYSSFSSLTPTVIRELIWGEKTKAVLVVETFNVTSYASPLYLDFGWAGVLLFTFTLMFCAVVVFRRLRRTNSLYYLLLLAILNHTIILSFFFNFLLTWGVVFQFVLIFLTKRHLIPMRASLRLTRIHRRGAHRRSQPVVPVASTLPL